MAKTTRNAVDRRLRRKTAAFRLKHDVGKALRWSAPDERETDAAALRARLLADLVPQSGSGRAKRDVLESFFEWKKEERAMFAADDPDLLAIERAVEKIAAARVALLSSAAPPPATPAPPSSPSKKSASLSSSYLSSLIALDETCLEASRRCTAFYRRIAVDDGPEIVRTRGASGVFSRRRGGGGA